MRNAMLIDLDRCIGCQACVSACKEGWDSGPGAARSWVTTFETGTRAAGDLAVTFYPGLCMQCESHPCTLECPTGATFVDESGVVVVDRDLCIGCGSCVAACPYGARRVDPVKGTVEKCNLCAPHVARGETPFCVATCPADARIFGDLDDPGSAIAIAARERAAAPLAAPEVDVRPRTLYVGDAARRRILSAGAVARPGRSALTGAWAVARPTARSVPALGAAAIAGGLVLNLRARAERVRAEEGVASAPPRELPRHSAGLRFLHWFNAASWVLLVVTGVGLFSTAGFALFGEAFPAWLAARTGGADALLRLHAGWGLLWAAVIVPLFLLFKGGVRHVWTDVRPTRDDLAWLARKPLAMIGLDRGPLPPQDKYNAGQKLFAVFVLAATAAIVATGLVMTFHLGSEALVAAAVVVHGAAVALTLVGVAVHFTMAAVLAEERPALRSMITGRIDAEHARAHCAKWAAFHEENQT